MGIRELYEKIKNRNNSFNSTFKQLQVEDKAVNRLEERKLSSNERELNKILAKKREEAITSQLKEYRKEEQNEYWHRNTIQQPYIFKHENSVLKNNSVLTDGGSILKQKNIFVNNRRLF